MTDTNTGDIRYCINGCQRNTSENRRIPARADLGDLCRLCVDRLIKWLGEIPERYALLPAYLLPSADLDRNPESQATKRPLAPVPVRLAALDLLDVRLARKWLGTAAADERRGTIGTLQTIANTIRTVRGSDTQLAGYVVTEADYIRDGLTVLANHPDVAEMYKTLRHLHRDLGDAVGQYPPRPVGRCFLVDDSLVHDDRSCSCNCGHPPDTDFEAEHDCAETWQDENECGGPLLPVETGVLCISCGAKWGTHALRLLGANLEVSA